MVILLAITLLILAGSTIIKYKVAPSEAYVLDKNNLIDDGSFENFNQTAGDCCNKYPDKSRVFASQSVNAFIGQYSLNLTSENQCACISKPIKELDNSQKYLLSFYYLGDNPRVCGWTTEDNKCIPEKRLETTNKWTNYQALLEFTNKSEKSLIHFYADSSGELRTNLYDDLQVRKLVKISSKAKFSESEAYIVKTKVDNKINGEKIGGEENGEAYFLVNGRPNITIRFPYYEIAIIVLIMLVIARILLKKEREEWE